MNEIRKAFDNKNIDAFIPARRISGFPYAIRSCKFCEKEMKTINAVHDIDNPEIYKSIMVCDNRNCGAFDEEAKQAYLKVYYSSSEAHKRFESIMLRFQRNDFTEQERTDYGNY